MHSLLQNRIAIAKRAGELSKIGMKRYQAENRLLLYPDISSSHSAQMDRINSRSEFRGELIKDLLKIREEFQRMAGLPIDYWDCMSYAKERHSP